MLGNVFFDIFFSSCDHRIFILIVTRLFNFLLFQELNVKWNSEIPHLEKSR